MGDSAFFDEVAERWDSMARHPQDKLAYILDRLGPIGAKRVLDIGTGTGVLIPGLHARVGQSGFVSAVDMSEKMLAVARRKFLRPNVEFIHADFCDFYPKLPYDALTAYSCFPHFHDKERFFKAALRCLAPGGLLLIAHSQSKEEINGVHRRIEDRVRYGGLTPVRDLAELALACGFAGRYLEDSADYYLYLGFKIA